MPKIGNVYHPKTEVPFSEPAEYLQGFKDNAEASAKGEQVATTGERAGVFGEKTGLNTSINSTPYPKIHVLGDSITEDPNGYVVMGGGDTWGDVLANKLDFDAGKKNNRGVNFRAGAEGFDGWDRLAYGINVMTWRSNASSQPLRIYFDNVSDFGEDIEMTLYYSCAPDGGTFTIKEGWSQGSGSTLAVGNCNGTLGEVKTVKWSQGADSQAWVNIDNPANPVYVYGWVGRRDSVPQGELSYVYNSSLGGRRLTEFSDDDLEATVNAFDADLFIMALGANDYAGDVTWETFNAKLQTLIALIESKGSHMAIVIQNRAQVADIGGPYEAKFNSYVDGLEGICYDKNYACVNIDTIWGGWASANAKGLLLDSIHPNSLGHTLIGKAVSEAILKGSYFGDKPDREGRYSGAIITGKRRLADTVISKGGASIPTTSPATWKSVFHNVQCGGSCLSTELPFRSNNLWVGFQIYVTDIEQLYICVQVDPSIVWRSVATVAVP